MNKQQRNIRNPELWIGKYVRHMANWWDFAWGTNGYVVCEHTGKLIRIEDEAVPMYEEDRALAITKGYNECYYYSEEAILYFTGVIN
jgi:hypothetical protein